MKASKKQMKKKKKPNFTHLIVNLNVAIMVDQIDRRKHVLFGSLSCCMSKKMKQVEWQKVPAVTTVSSELWILVEIFLISDFKCEAKKKTDLCTQQPWHSLYLMSTLLLFWAKLPLVAEEEEHHHYPI